MGPSLRRFYCDFELPVLSPSPELHGRAESPVESHGRASELLTCRNSVFTPAASCAGDTPRRAFPGGGSSLSPTAPREDEWVLVEAACPPASVAGALGWSVGASAAHGPAGAPGSAVARAPAAGGVCARGGRGVAVPCGDPADQQLFPGKHPPPPGHLWACFWTSRPRACRSLCLCRQLRVVGACVAGVAVFGSLRHWWGTFFGRGPLGYL